MLRGGGGARRGGAGADPGGGGTGRNTLLGRDEMSGTDGATRDGGCGA